MSKLFQFFLVFIAIAAAVFLLDQKALVEFGRENYWDHHGIIFLLFLAAFPRLTLLFSSVASGGILWWLSWLLVPRFLVAILATLTYWKQNPILVVFSWLIALGGESSEKFVIVRRSIRRPKFHRRQAGEGVIIDVTPERK
jgi:hypothetical protein